MRQRTSTCEHSLPSLITWPLLFPGAHAIPGIFPRQVAVAALVSLGDAVRKAVIATATIYLSLYLACFGLGTCSIK
jgi:Na+/proline symporter